MSTLEGRIALVTGASRGIGRAIALRLAAEGADVSIGFFRDRDGAEKTAAGVEELGRRAIVVKGHLGDEDRTRQIADDTRDRLGPPTILISNAASGVLKPLAEIDERAWRWTMDVNARALLILSQCVRGGMRAAGGGSIVALSSLGSERTLPGYGVVGTSKAAIEALVRYLAVEGAPDGIRVNAVSAGVVDTDALRHFPNRDELLAAAAARTPAGRMVNPDDLAGVVAFLCSDEAWMIRGETLRVDGGYSLIA
jgi:enoyl-[acyl-carrier protein] reductase III